MSTELTDAEIMNIHAERILEKIMFRKNWSAADRDNLAEYLDLMVRRSGGKCHKLKREERVDIFREGIIKALKSGPKTVREIGEGAGLVISSVKNRAEQMTKKGELVVIGRRRQAFIYRLAL